MHGTFWNLLVDDGDLCFDFYVIRQQLNSGCQNDFVFFMICNTPVPVP